MELDLGLPWVAPLVSVVLAITFLGVWRRGRDIPALDVRLEDAVRDLPRKASSSHQIRCYDPATLEEFGYAHAMSAAEVRDIIAKTRLASKDWKKSSFAQRRMLLKILLKFTVENQADICRVSALDSGKPLVDASFGEVLGTCEKIWWLVAEGERYLRPERRSSGYMMFYKKARVEYHPVGVVGTIVPWNYPFHNILNPLTAAVFAGNGIVIKVSEHATWSALVYQRVIDAALAAAGAPPDLVRIVTGFGEAGGALVTGGVDKLIFVGSTAIGHKVLEAAATTLTPVVLELGGKDAFIVLEDADLATVTATALRGAFQSCGQNCAGAERFIVAERLFEEFVQRCVAVAGKLRQGPAAGEDVVDCGSMCMPGQAEKVQELVDDAVAQGAKVGFGVPCSLCAGQALSGAGLAVLRGGWDPGAAPSCMPLPSIPSRTRVVWPGVASTPAGFARPPPSPTPGVDRRAPAGHGEGPLLPADHHHRCRTGHAYLGGGGLWTRHVR
ncbi:ALDH22 [Auxenochlorella protothecoides x Auxenochlorella symbiontica]